nr:putative ribonuclease H-like domain-containing protein [Tanacetum cinerariifolium]
MLQQAETKTRRNLVLAVGDPAGSIVSTSGVPAGSVPAGSIPTSSAPAGRVPASHVPTSSIPANSVPAGGIPPSSVPTSRVPASHVPASSIPAGGILAGSIDSTEFGDPAASESVSTIFTTDPAAISPLPPGHSLGSSEHTTRFPSPSDLGNHQPTTGIFSSSSYDADFCANVTNLALNITVDHVATKRVNTIHPQFQIIKELQSPIQTRSTMQKSKFGKSAFISYVYHQNRTNHAVHLHCLFACFLSQLEPSSVAKALKDPDWVASIGIVVRNKARLVAQGHKQEEGIDYDEVFASVAQIEAIRLFLAFASYMGFMVYQMDVKSAFLYGEIEEEVHVTQSKGFEDPHNPKHVYRIVKALYGLHQAPRAWYARLSTFLLKHHYRRETIDKTLFFKKDSKHIILVQIYVDDIIFGSTNKAWCDEFEVLMKGEFEMSAMGELTFFLGLQVKQLPDGIFISQDKYVKDMLKKFDMESVRTATTPYEVPKHKSKDEPDDAVNVHLFRSMIGSLIYLIASRPDIMFAVSACSRHQVTPMTSHLNAVKYLKGQPNLGLWYPRDSPFQLEAYSDSDYAGSHGNRKSTTGGCQFLGRRLISWQCKKQTVVATFSTEAEYVAAASCCGTGIRGRNKPKGRLTIVYSVYTNFCAGLCVYPYTFLSILSYRMNAVSCGVLLYAVHIISRCLMLLVVPVFLLVVLVHVDGSYRWLYSSCWWLLVHVVGLVPTGSGTNSAGSYLFILVDRFLLDDHNKVAYMEKGKGWEAYDQILDFLNRSHIRYALTHRPPIVFDSLVKQFCATATVHTLKAGPSDIIATIDGNEVVVTESLIRTQLQLNDVNRLYKFTLHDVLDRMQAIGYPIDGSLTFYKAKLSPQWRFLIHTLIHCMSPKFGGWNQFPSSIASALILVPAGGDGAAAVAAGVAAAHDVSPPLPPPTVPPTHSTSSTPGPSTADQATPVREQTPVREPSPARKPTPSPIREPTLFQEPIPDSPRPLSPTPYPQSEEVGPTTSTRPPSLTRHTFFHEDISEGGGDFVSSPKSNEAPQNPAATADGGAEDSAALTALSLKLDRCINRVTSLETELGVTKKVLDGAVLKLVTRVKWLEGLLQQRKRRLVLFDSEGEEAVTKEQDIDLDALHKLASTSLGGDSTVEAAYTIYTASQDAHSSSDAGHAAAEVPDDTTMPFRRMTTMRRHLRKSFTSSASEHFQEIIPAAALTIPTGEGILAGSTTIPAGNSMDPTVQVAAAAPSSTIPATDKGKAPMVDDSLPADLLSEQERILKNLYDYQLGEELAKKLYAEQETEFARQRELAEQYRVKPMTKTQQRDYMRDFVKNQSASVYNQGWTMKQVPASVSVGPSVAIDISVPAAPLVTADISVPAVPPAHAAVFVPADTEVHTNESRLDDPHTASEHVSTEPTVDASTSSSLRTRRKHLAKKRVTPIMDIADAALIKFDNASDSDDDPLPYAPYASWEMVPSPLGSIHAYYDMDGHTKHFTSLRKLLHMVEKNDLRRLLGAIDDLYQREEPDTFALLLWGDLHVLFQSLDDEDAHDFWRNQDSWRICSWRLYPRAQVHVLETVDGRVIHMFVDVSYPLSAATLQHMLKHGLEVPKLLVGGDLTMAEQLVSFIKAALLTAQSTA